MHSGNQYSQSSGSELAFDVVRIAAHKSDFGFMVRSFDL